MFEITDYEELGALNKALFESRYLHDIDHTEAPGSPLVAAIHERVLSALFEHDDVSQNRIDEWLRWRNRTIEQKRVRLYLTKCDWARCPATSKRVLVENLVRPFVATEEEIDDLVEFADSQLPNSTEKNIATIPMKTIDDLAGEIESTIASIHRRTQMFIGSTDEPGASIALDGMLWLAYSFWASAKEREGELRRNLSSVRERYQCDGQGFPNAFRRLNPSSGEDAACQFVLQCWEEIAKEIGIEIAS
jgi:hypothetical protein